MRRWPGHSCPLTRAARIIAALCCGGLFLPACTQTLFFLEDSAFKLGISVNDDPTTPLEVTAGVKRKVLSVTPPKEPIQSAESGRRVASGEPVSLVSRFDVRYFEGDGPFGGTLRIANAFASGEAARTVASDKNAMSALLGVRLLAAISPDQIKLENQARVDAILTKINALPQEQAIEIVRNPPGEMNDKMRSTLDQRDPLGQWQASGVVAKDILQLWFGGDVDVGDYAAWEQALGVTR